MIMPTLIIPAKLRAFRKRAGIKSANPSDGRIVKAIELPFVLRGEKERCLISFSCQNSKSASPTPMDDFKMAIIDIVLAIV